MVREMLPQLVISQLESRAADITRINRENLKKGQLSTRKVIKPDYSEDYEKIKGFKRPNLYLTGDFYSSIYAISDPSGFELLVGSDDTIGDFRKAEYLEDKYGSDIYSIQPKQLAKILEEEKDNIIKITLDELRA